MTLTDEPLHDFPDRALRQSLLHPENLHVFLRQAVPGLADGFDCSRARYLEREFPLDDWRRREADLPFEIPFRHGEEELQALVFVLIEHQSSVDPWMPLRLLVYVTLYWERLWKVWEQATVPRPQPRLPPVLPIVLHKGSRPWSGNRTLADLLAEPTSFHPFAPVWQPLFWNLAEQTPQGLLASAGEWLQVLAVVRAEGESAAEFQAVFSEAIRHLESLYGSDRVRWYDLLRIVLTWAVWRRPRAEHDGLVAAARASQAEAARQQEIQTMTEQLGETLAEWAIAKGIREGRAEGVREGRAEGVQEGRAEGERIGQLRGCRDTLYLLLADRFRDLPQELRQRIEAIDDLDRLQSAIRQVSRLQKLDDLQL
jgi:hypothetical protein